MYDRQSNRSAITRFLLFFLVAWMVFNWLETVQRILHCYTAAPTGDYWRVALYAPRYRAMDMSVFWTQHNEHRILFPEIVFALDMLALHGRHILPLAVSFVCYFSSWLVLAWTLFSDRKFSPTVRNCAILLAGVVVGWKGSASVLADPFLLQWTLMSFCVLLSLAFLCRVKEAPSNFPLILCIASAIISTYSSANALLLWPLLIACGFLLGLSRRQITILAIAASVSLALYFVGYTFSSHVDILALLAHPFYLLGFVGSYLSMPFGGMKGPDFGAFVGLISLFVVIVLFIVAARSRLLISPPAVVLFGWYSFTLLTVLLTAAGRMDLQDSGFGVAKTARYLTVPLMTWAVSISLCIWLASRCRWKIASAPAISFIVAVLLFMGFLKLRRWVEGNDNGFANQQMVALSFENGLGDPGLIRKIFPDPGLVYRCLPYLQEHDLSVFNKNRKKLLGVPVERFSHVLSTPAIGEVSYTFPVRAGVEVVGWADALSFRGAQYASIVLTNETGRIAGFGERLRAGFPADLRTPHTPPSLAWVGFLNLEIPAHSFTAYVVDPRRKGLFLIPGSFAVPEIRAMSVHDLGLPITGIQWERDAAWTRDGYPTASLFDTPPPEPIYASWSGSHTNTGRMISSIFPAPENDCMILPVLHGPLATGQSIEIQDADTGKPAITIPMQNGDSQWQFWRLPFNSAVKHLRIIAGDEGRDWGEWLAVGPPSRCE